MMIVLPISGRIISRACLFMVISVIFLVGSRPYQGALASGIASQPSNTAEEQDPQVPSGTIAYLRGFSEERNNNATEIRLIEADGTGDQRLWEVPHPEITTAGLHFLDWSPDGTELAFTSGHEDYCSIYIYDVYTIKPDGTGLRRVTNGPKCDELTSYPKGSVNVSVTNYRFTSVFLFVYVQGAPSVKPLSLGPGETGSVLFEDVADFGDAFQQAVAIEGLYRHIAPITGGDVKPGETLDAGTLTITSSGLADFGARHLAWNYNGSKIYYALSCVMKYISSQPAPGSNGDVLLTNPNVFGCPIDAGPTAALANQVLYGDMFADGIYLVSEGASGPGTELVDLGGNILDGLRWLPDGSGFLFSHFDLYLSKANIFRYDIATEELTQLTFVEGEYMGDMTVSPDGQYVVFQRYVPGQSGSDLWIMTIDGEDLKLLVEDGSRPVWAPAASEPPTNSDQLIFLPFVKR
jgi:WD40 repeat protein